MVSFPGNETREDSLKTHGLRELRSVIVEALLVVNGSSFLISSSWFITRLFPHLVLWACSFIVIVIGGYLLTLMYRGDRVGYLFFFCIGLGVSLALRHL